MDFKDMEYFINYDAYPYAYPCRYCRVMCREGEKPSCCIKGISRRFIIRTERKIMSKFQEIIRIIDIRLDRFKLWLLGFEKFKNSDFQIDRAFGWEVQEKEDMSVTFKFSGYLIHGMSNRLVRVLDRLVDDLIHYHNNEGWRVIIDLRQVIRVDSLFTGLVKEKFNAKNIEEDRFSFMYKPETDVQRALIDSGIINKEKE